MTYFVLSLIFVLQFMLVRTVAGYAQRVKDSSDTQVNKLFLGFAVLATILAPSASFVVGRFQ